QPVAELDRAVDPEAAVGDERLVGAARPRRAAQAGAGEPYDTAREDDADVGHQRGPGQDEQGAGTVGHEASHSQENVRAVSTVPTAAQPSRTRTAGQGRAPSRRAVRRPSPSAPEGSHVATTPNPPYVEAGTTT